MEQQIQQLINMTEKSLTQITTSIGTTLPQLWGVLIKQQYIEAIKSFVILGICVIIWNITFKKRKEIDKKLNNNDDLVPFFIIFIGTLIGISLASLIMSIQGIGQIINPEYYAIKDIIEQLGTLTNKE